MAVCDLVKQLMALDWALVCRTHVATLMAQIRAFSTNQQPHNLLPFTNQQPGGLVSIKQSIKEGEGEKKGPLSHLKTKAKAMSHFSFTAKRSFTRDRRIPSPMEIEKQERAHLLLLRWCAALIWADRFHVDTELQATIHSALSSIIVTISAPAEASRRGEGESDDGRASARSSAFVDILHPPPPPLILVTLVESALRKRNLFNARLAEQINRLKPKPSHASSGHDGKDNLGSDLVSSSSAASLGSRGFKRQASESTKVRAGYY